MTQPVSPDRWIGRWGDVTNQMVVEQGSRDSVLVGDVGDVFGNLVCLPYLGRKR